MVKKTIDARLRELEERLIVPSPHICEVCGAENGGRIITETHHKDRVVSYYPHLPCRGCDKVRPSGGVRRIVICPVGCWCGRDQTKVEAAPKVSLDEADEAAFEQYASGAAKYHRRLRESREED